MFLLHDRWGSILTWTHTEDLLKISTDTHLLVKLRRLGQVGTGFKVRHSEDICSTFTGSWKRQMLNLENAVYSSMNSTQ